jgi:hypothetical protein
MLRLYDARAGHVSDVHPARPGRLVIHVDPDCDLRGLVLADLIRRFSERDRLRVFWFSDQAPAELNVRPGVGGDPPYADLCVGEISIPEPQRTGSVRQLELGPPLGPLPAPAEVAERGLDPLALRLAMLRSHYREGLELSWDDLADADAEIARWRTAVARWARSPGRPMSSAYIAETDAAFCDDLNVPAALKIMRQLAADDSISPGARFESFVHLDLVLALDLVALVGT